MTSSTGLPGLLRSDEKDSVRIDQLNPSRSDNRLLKRDVIDFEVSALPFNDF